MTTTPINDTSIASGFNVDELTEGSLTGKGVLDVLLQTLRLHLDREFTSGRITGTAYATVYAQAITAFLAQAAQYALSKAKLPLELQLLEKQITLAQKQQDQITAAIRQSDYVTDFQLPSEVANKDKTTALLEYDLTYLKPVELSIAQEDLALKQAQTSLVEYDLTTIKPQELALLQQQVAAQLYTVQTRLPVEVLGIEADNALKAYDLANIKPAELESIAADTSLKDYELTDIKPTQKAQIVAETSHVTKQELNTVQQTLNLGSQQAQIETETDRILYEITNKLPEEVQLIKLNQDQLIAQNNKIATDTVVTIKQGHLTDAQTCQVTAQTNQVNAEVALKLPAEISQLEAQTALLDYDLATVKPVEVSNLTKQGLLVDSQKVVADKQALNVIAETNQINYRTDYQLPEEVEILKRNQTQLTSQIAEINYRTTTLMPSQTAQTTAQTAQVTYTTANVLPAQVALTTAQADSADAQTALYAQKTTTELAQAVTTPASDSVMGVQNALMKKQIDSYSRDAEQKAAKLLIDTWNTRMTAHPDDTNFTEFNRLRDVDIGSAVDKMLDGIGVV